MDYYIDIKIQPDAEMRENFLLNKVYTKLHKALFELKARDIAVSFPDYQITLGRVLRLHSTQARLIELQALNFLGGLSGYCKISAILPIPNLVQYRIISRIQPSMSLAKLQRLKKRASISENDSKAYKAKMFERGLDNPYVEIESTSNGHLYRRYLSFGELMNESSKGEFDYFGLSRNSSVPIF
ncbi:MAG: type I-F CRISPR-associated endoribonuclease Cas6/Csy4 [Methylococcaceae bacterium]